MHYGIIGMGPIGSIIAAHLGQAGHRVSVLCWGQHKFDALAKRPLVVRGALQAQTQLKDLYLKLGEFVAAKPEVVLIATKSADSPGILRDLRAAGIPESTVFVSCQNGLDVEQQIVKEFGAARAFRMVVNLGAKLVSDSEAYVGFAYINYLSLTPEVDERLCGRIASEMDASGFKMAPRSDYQTEVYKKAILNCSLSSLCALTGRTMREVIEDPELLKTTERLIAEAIAVAQALKLPIGDEYLEEAVTYMRKGGDHKPSMAIDVESKRKTENDDHCGRICEYARNFGIDVPVTETVCHLIRNLELSYLKNGESK